MSNLQEELNPLDNSMTRFYQMEFQFHLIIFMSCKMSLRLLGMTLRLG